MLGHVAEGSVVIVLVQDAAPVSGHQHVRPAVVVVIPNGDAHAEIRPGHAGLFRDVGKRAVAVVLVQGIAQRLGWLVKIAGAAVHQKDIHPAVVVVIQKGAARAQRFGQEAARRHRVFMHPGDAGGRRRHFAEQRSARSCDAAGEETRRTFAAPASMPNRRSPRLEKVIEPILICSAFVPLPCRKQRGTPERLCQQK